MNLKRISHILLTGVLMLGSVLVYTIASPTALKTASADSCTPPATTFGTDTMSVPVQSTGTYYLWIRMQTPAASSNSILLNIDNSSCFNMGGSGSMPVNTWTWVNYANGSVLTPITVSLTAGTHSFKLTGTQTGISIDRIEALADSACRPTGTGDNCTPINNPTDTTAPNVQIGQSPSGVTKSTSANISFSATDVDNAPATLTYKCSFDNAAYSTCSSPISQTNLTSGQHNFAVKASDPAGNTSTAATSNWTVDTVAPTVSISAPSSGSTVSGNVSIAATASDNVAVGSVQFKIDGQNVGSPDSSSPYSYTWSTQGVSNGPHTIAAIATDTAGNSTTSTSITINVSSATVDTTPPSVPTGVVADSNSPPSATSIGIQWNASTDNAGGSGVGGYRIYRDGTEVGSVGSSTTNYVDSGLTTGTSYSYTVVAYDNAGNSSAKSTPVSIKTASLIGDINGDGHVTFDDLVILLDTYNTNYPKAEFDGYNIVEANDLFLLLQNYGK